MSKYSENMPPDIAGAIGWMLNLIKPGSTFLDFGCSTGYFGNYIKQHRNCSVYGVEISADRAAATKVLDGVYSFDLDQDWPKEVFERTYDYLFFGDVLEHLKDPVATLKKCQKLLKKDGKILISVPNIAHMSIRLELLRGDFTYESMGILDNTHLQYFTLATFGDYAMKAGYNLKLVDFTPNDMPKEITEQQLADVGLKASSKFWEIMKTTEARAYQYKFILSLPKNGAKPEVSQSVKPKPLQLRDDIISSYSEQLEALDAHSKEQAKIINHYQQLSQQLEAELSSNLSASESKKVLKYIFRKVKK